MKAELLIALGVLVLLLAVFLAGLFWALQRGLKGF